ncbi:hypothetical protein GOARA_036_01360 [Gordonia araii NBRC 100433]|uniref:Heavy metal-binding domain-containing protein n=1 Tax=Gordonia araii NBRC 100433 TaxID=1073574 RepID=G7H0M9_9ACTN|nr:hypothetical protein [Gordonia araii]NNG96833.1 heavy-metal-associated domain-containing protein [Gordonia araii NBRC 100433]GAB09404.1 hypothetical protein GOARA_036_01360 [Gordonia araii NBRC 100433]
MKAPVRLSLFAAGLVAVFAAALLVGRYVVPDQSGQSADRGDHGHSAGEQDARDGAHDGHDDDHGAVAGTSRTADGYALAGLSGPGRAGEQGPLRFTINDADGKALTEFTPAHEKELHLIVVRSDGQHFAHVHPQRDAAGAWTTPWRAPAAGTYRVFADFVPGDRDGDDPVVLSSDLEVGGDFAPVAAQPGRTSTVDGFTATLEGTLKANAAQTLTIRVTHGGEHPVALQPYLGARGHLVALRSGDLAYTHVHPLDGEHDAGSTGHDDHGDGHAGHGGSAHGDAGTVSFSAQAPSTGRYLLYFDFQVDGVVRTATFVVDTEN